MPEYPNIEVLEYPIETDYAHLISDHPACDAIIFPIGTGPKVMLYAYAKSEEGNGEIKNYRDRYMSEMEIQAGLSEDALNSLL